MKPLIRWAGGKSRYAAAIAALFPSGMASYGEPFVGSGAVLLELHNQGKLQEGARVVLSDTGAVLELWRSLTRCPGELIDQYEAIRKRLDLSFGANVKAAYRAAVVEFNIGSLSGPAQAAYFLYLNQLCFNGLFRVNRKGLYNTPFAEGRTVRCLTEDIRRLSDELSKYCLTVADERSALDDVQNLYVDPPYDGKGSFTAYTSDGFDSSRQRAVSDWCFEWLSGGAFVVASNADTPLIRELYEGFAINEFGRRNTMSAKASSRQEKRPELLMVGGNHG